MTLHKLTLGSILLLCSSFLMGCASSQMQIRQPLETKLSRYPNFLFSANTAIAEDVKDEIADLETAVAVSVKKLNLFRSVGLGDGQGGSEGTLIVKAVISDINKVSGASRFFLGVFAGTASMTIDVTFLDASDGRIIGAFKVTGKSGGTGYAGGTSEAVEKTADGIADLISQNYN